MKLHILQFNIFCKGSNIILSDYRMFYLKQLQIQ
jgi:hypothetical protein